MKARQCKISLSWLQKSLFDDELSDEELCSLDEDQIESPQYDESSMMLEESEDTSKKSQSEEEDLLTLCDEDALFEFAKKDK